MYCVADREVVMRLIYRILLRLSIILLILLAGWAVYFYVNIINEVNDETDDSLEDYSEMIIKRTLVGLDLPSDNNSTNNRFHISEITQDYIYTHPSIEYLDEMIFIPEKNETEPARTLKTVFKNKNGDYLLLTVSVPTIDKDDLKEAILYWIILLYVILLSTILMVNVWVYYRSMKPLYMLLHWFDTYKIGTKSKPLKNDTNIYEFRKLNDAVIRHTVRTEHAFELQKEFIGNASHELQTPLAICQNRLEMLADSSSLTEEQLGEIIKTQQTIENAVRLNKSLLFLSKIDNGQFPDHTEVDINLLIRNMIEDLEEIYAYRNITLTFTESAPLHVLMHESLASALISNLLKNAFVHNKDNGRIFIDVSARGLTVRNTGEDGPLDEAHIFERFYQKNKKKGSGGLGLSIVEAICKMHCISIRYEYLDQQHSFILTFSKKNRWGN